MDEDVFKKQGHAPAKLAALLARAKAEAVFMKNSNALVIGGDQVAALGDLILSKPGTVDQAVKQLMKLQGQTHELHTAVHHLGPGIDIPLMETTRLTMRALSEADARRYIEIDQPLDCAGSYKLESRGIKLFTHIEGGDHDAIVGLPLMTLQAALTKAGFKLF